MRGTIRLIRASAGSGKTHEITHALVDLIERGEVAAADVVATTFTVKAAGELRGRIRALLLSRGCERHARDVDRALIGTVHAVCQRLIVRHALLAGRSPMTRLVPEEELNEANPMRRVLHRAIDRAREREMITLARRLDVEDFREHVIDIAEMLRVYRIGAAGVARSKQRSLASLFALPTFGTGRFDFDPVADALAGAAAAMRSAAPPVKPNLDTDHDLAMLRAAVQEQAFLPLAEIQYTRPLGAKPDSLLDEARPHCGGWEASAALRDTLSEYVDGCFDLAQATCGAWEEYKRSERLLDFTDLEVGAVELLDDERNLAAIAGSISALVVDEFQDTNPIQLSLFARLVPHVPHAIWVGDPKQAIYGFRHTDPELVAASYEALRQRGARVDVLPGNWRSRPDLVHFTGRLFAHTFGGEHVPDDVRMAAEDVCLEPRRDDPDELPRPAVRVWRVAPQPPPPGSTKKPKATKANFARALATGLAQRLEQPERHPVYDKQTGEVRPLRPGDVAVVMRQRSHCQEMAAALQAHGIAATAETPGLLDSFEGRTAFAALTVATHRRTPLESAELQFLLGTEDPDRWLASLLRDGIPTPRPADEGARVDDPTRDEPRAVLARLHALADTLLVATPSEMLDAVIGALDLPRRCRAAGMEGVRLANLERLRFVATQYENLRAARRLPPTAAGLCRHLLALEKDGADHLAPDAQDAVTVLTCHASKGLEWPLVVVGMLDERSGKKHHVLAGTGVHVERAPGDAAADGPAASVPDDPDGSFADPLAGRWVRFWPHPFGSKEKLPGKVPLGAALDGTPEAEQARLRIDREDQRLLYVALTRARDVLVLPIDEASDKASLWDLCFPHAPLPHADEDDFAHTGVPVEVEHVAAREPQPQPLATPPTWSGRGPGGRRTTRTVGFGAWEHAGPRSVGAARTLGSPLTLELGDVPPRALGIAVHAFFAADVEGLDDASRQALARRLVTGHGVQAVLRPELLLDLGDRLRAALEQRFPGAELHREWPLALEHEGRLVRGQADLLLRTDSGWWVLDHKTVRHAPDAESLADYARQVAGYGRALWLALGEPVLGGLIHLPLQGELVHVELPGLA